MFSNIVSQASSAPLGGWISYRLYYMSFLKCLLSVSLVVLPPSDLDIEFILSS